MKKLSFISFLIVALAVSSFASDKAFDANLKNNIRANFKGVENVKILSTDKLNSINGLNFVVFSSSDTNETTPIFVSDDGKSILSFPKLAVFASKVDNDIIDQRTKNLKVNQVKKQEKIVYEIIKTIPKDRFIEIQSFDKNNKFITYMVTDPECPYCRAEIDKIVKWLRNANVKIIFAPVHGKSAYTKSAIMLKEAKKLKVDNQKAMIALLQKYYDKDVVVSDNEVSDKERELVLEDAKKLFSKGAIKGVPFMLTIEK